MDKYEKVRQMGKVIPGFYETLKNIKKDFFHWLGTKDIRIIIPFLDALVTDKEISNHQRILLENYIKDFLKSLKEYGEVIMNEKKFMVYSYEGENAVNRVAVIKNLKKINEIYDYEEIGAF